MLSAVTLYGLRAAVVYADAGYFSHPFVWFVRTLGAVPVIDYNLRRRGKRFLATRFFVDQWRRLRAPRTAVERCFAFLKRYFGLKYFQVQGLPAVWCPVQVHRHPLQFAYIVSRGARRAGVGLWPWCAAPPAGRRRQRSRCG